MRYRVHRQSPHSWGMTEWEKGKANQQLMFLASRVLGLNPISHVHLNSHKASVVSALGRKRLKAQKGEQRSPPYTPGLDCDWTLLHAWGNVHPTGVAPLKGRQTGDILRMRCTGGQREACSECGYTLQEPGV